jgi:hypothetical protein
MGLVTILEQLLSLAVLPGDGEDAGAERSEASPSEPDADPVPRDWSRLDDDLTTAAVEARGREQAPAPEAPTPQERREVPAVSYPVEVGGSVEPRDGNRLEQLDAAITVAESLNLGLHLGLAVERIAHAAPRGSEGVDSLREAVWLIERYIGHVEQQQPGGHS